MTTIEIKPNDPADLELFVRIDGDPCREHDEDDWTLTIETPGDTTVKITCDDDDELSEFINWLQEFWELKFVYRWI